MVLERLDTFEVVGEALLALKVHGAVDLERQLQLGAIEVDDVAPHGLLAAERETVAAAIAQQLPGGAFGRSGGATKFPCELALDARHPRVADDGWLHTVPRLMGHTDLSSPPGMPLRSFVRAAPLSRSGRGGLGGEVLGNSSSGQPHECAGQVQKREEVARELLEAHGDPAEAFDPLEEALDQVPLFVEVAVELVLLCARRIRWNHDRAAVRYELLTQRPGVIRAVTSNVGVGDVAEQLVSELHLVPLARGQRNPDGVTEGVDYGVDLRGRTSARAPDFLGPPL